MKKVLLVPVVAGISFITLSTTYAFPGFAQDDTDEQRGGFGQHQGGEHHPMRKEAFHAFVEAGDYQGFVSSAPEQLLTIINSPEAFEQLQALHAAKQAGDDTTAQALAEALGLPERGARVGPNSENHEALMAALDEGDYEAFLAVADERLLTTIDDEDKFVLFVELHEAKQLGDTERVKELSQELGLPPKGVNAGFVHKKGKGMLRKAMRVDEIETYEGFQEQYSDKPLVAKVTLEAFDLLKALIAAYDAGEKETMQALAQQLKVLLQ